MTLGSGPETGGEPAVFVASAAAAAHVFVDALDDTVFVGGDDGHHLQRVRRLRVGEHVTAAAANSSGRWRRYVIARTAPGHVVLVADGAPRYEPVRAPRLAVAFALSKGPKPETVVSGLTELGVDRIVPFRSARSVVRWEGERVWTATARLRRVAREAAVQCRRARIPEVGEPVDFASLLDHPAVVVGDRAGVSAATVTLPTAHEWLAVVGPEGGLDPVERDRLETNAGARLMNIGTHVLRAETAALALAAVLTTRRYGLEPRSGHGA